MKCHRHVEFKITPKAKSALDFDDPITILDCILYEPKFFELRVRPKFAALHHVL